MFYVRLSGERVDADGDSQPIKQIRERIEDLQPPYGQEDCPAEEDAERAVDGEWSEGFEERGAEVVGGFVLDVSERRRELEEADVEDGELGHADEHEVRGFADHHAGKSERGED